MSQTSTSSTVFPNYGFDIDAVNAELQSKSPEQILAWALATFGSRLAVQSSMQKTAGVLMHMISQVSPQTEIIFVDTGVHFPETLDLRDEYRRRFGLNIQTYSAERTFEQQREDYGRDLYQHDDTSGEMPGYLFCCKLRKEAPFLAAVQGRFDAVVSGLTRAEGGARKNVQVVSEDPRIPGFKIHPLAFWTEEQIDEYTKAHDLPVHALYEKGFASIGCWTCTTPIAAGEDKRAGRWRHIREKRADAGPLYCGINLDDLRKK